MRPWPPINKVLTTDDVCLSNLKFWKYWLEVKEHYPDIKVIAFVIANYKHEENVYQSQEFREWFDANKSWVTVGVHGYDHELPQEGFRDDQKAYIAKALDLLRPFLPEQFLYRPPGFRFMAKTEGILKQLGFAGIAHRDRIKYFDKRYELPYNTHCCDSYMNPVTQWRNWE
jgi:predicted deacetylase